jgi:hypothetical protein
MTIGKLASRSKTDAKFGGQTLRRHASCVCGQLAVTVDGDPLRVNVCNCKDCQRRSGSAFQIGAWFEEGQVRKRKGEARIYSRPGKSGRTVDLQFCPNCGVAVCYTADERPGWLGIHGGCFADPDFPAPSHVLYRRNKYRWVTLPEVEHSFEEDG